MNQFQKTGEFDDDNFDKDEYNEENMISMITMKMISKRPPVQGHGFSLREEEDSMKVFQVKANRVLIMMIKILMKGQ